MSAAVQRHPMTVEEFLRWAPPADHDRWELLYGFPRAMAPPSIRHGAIQGEAYRLIANHLAEHRPHCRAIITPGVQPRVRARINVRIPDLGVTCQATAPDDSLLREPILLLEVLSPSNAEETWRNVMHYVTIASVQEILVLHTSEIRADLLRRQADGNWPEDPQPLTAGEHITLNSISFAAPLAAFYRTA